MSNYITSTELGTRRYWNTVARTATGERYPITVAVEATGWASEFAGQAWVTYWRTLDAIPSNITGDPAEIVDFIVLTEADLVPAATINRAALAEILEH